MLGVRSKSRRVRLILGLIPLLRDCAIIDLTPGSDQATRRQAASSVEYGAARVALPAEQRALSLG